MTKVLLINQEKIPPYRVPVYNHLAAYLAKEQFALTIVSEGTQQGSAHPIEFDHKELSLSFPKLAKLILELNPDVVIYWVRLRHLYLFPLLLLLKLLGKKAIYWGHGLDLAKKKAMKLKQFANSIEYWISDALILYGDQQRKYVRPRFHDKVFIANNTLCFNNYDDRTPDKKACLSKHKITTRKNIICVGRMQRRKRLEDLFEAFRRLNRPDVGLILVGPDTDGILQKVEGDNIYKLGPIYGDERLDLLSAADVFCLPGAVGLSIVDAFHCGLPIVTEQGDESPEIMYLKEGVNGFVVPRGDARQLALKLQLLLNNDPLRAQFSRAARNEITTNGHIDRMCKGFSEALRFVCHQGTPPGVDAGADLAESIPNGGRNRELVSVTSQNHAQK